MTPKISVILIHLNQEADTRECILSLQHITRQNVELIVVDNGSTDGSVDHLQGQFPSVRFVQTGENLGFAGGNNIGIDNALQSGADYVALLNNDTVVDKDFLD